MPNPTDESKASLAQPMSSIDLNCDMGESYGERIVGDDEQIMPLVTSANIACGFHGGDSATMNQVVTMAIDHGVQIGAHPSSHRDLEGFGRRPFELSHDILASNLRQQFETLSKVVGKKGGRLSYVKPHGSLYHAIQSDAETAAVFVEEVARLDDQVKILAAENETLRQLCAQFALTLIPEGFADRRYRSNGQLVARSEPNAVIANPEDAARQSIGLAVQSSVIASDGSKIPISCRSICVHGDSPNAVATLKAIRVAASREAIHIAAF